MIIPRMSDDSAAHERCEIAQRRPPGVDVLKSFGGCENSLHQRSVGVGDYSEDE